MVAGKGGIEHGAKVVEDFSLLSKYFSLKQMMSINKITKYGHILILNLYFTFLLKESLKSHFNNFRYFKYKITHAMSKISYFYTCSSCSIVSYV
jgi:hypothetical protein